MTWTKTPLICLGPGRDRFWPKIISSFLLIWVFALEILQKWWKKPGLPATLLTLAIKQLCCGSQSDMIKTDDLNFATDIITTSPSFLIDNLSDNRPKLWPGLRHHPFAWGAGGDGAGKWRSRWVSFPESREQKNGRPSPRLRNVVLPERLSLQVH